MTEKYKQLIKNKEDKINQLNQKILHYRSELNKYKHEIVRLSKRSHGKLESEPAPPVKAAVEEENTISPVFSYFSYASFLEKETEKDKTIDIIGHFTFQNVTNKSILDPLICFRIKPITKINLGGKISTSNNLKNKYTEIGEEWVYIQKDWVKEKGEHWLKPLHMKELKPFEKGQFANYNISIELTPEYSHYLIEGFFYSRNHRSGIPAVNAISLYL